MYPISDHEGGRSGRSPDESALRRLADEVRRWRPVRIHDGDLDCVCLLTAPYYHRSNGGIFHIFGHIGDRLVAATVKFEPGPVLDAERLRWEIGRLRSSFNVHLLARMAKAVGFGEVFAAGTGKNCEAANLRRQIATTIGGFGDVDGPEMSCAVRDLLADRDLLAVIGRLLGPLPEGLFLLDPDAAGTHIRRLEEAPRLVGLFRRHPLVGASLLKFARPQSDSAPAASGDDVDLAMSAMRPPSCPADAVGVDPRHERRVVEALFGLDDMPSFVVWRHRWVAGIAGVEDVAGSLFRMLRLMPPEWIPADEDSWCAAYALSVLLDALPAEDVCRQLRSSGGRWSAVCRSIYRLSSYRQPAPASPTSPLPDVRILRAISGDIVKAFCVQVLGPVAYQIGRHGGAVRPDLGWDEFCATLPKLNSMSRCAGRVLFGEKGIVARYELTARWHRRAEAMARVLRSGSAQREWPAGIPAVSFVGSLGSVVEVVPLVSDAMLTDEGTIGADGDGVPGLWHCVGNGSYAADCIAGNIRIVSLRRRDAEGRMIRLSTAELGIDRDRRVVVPVPLQHRGHRNMTPSEESEEVLALYIRHLADAPIDWSVFRPPGDATAHRPLFDGCGYDASDEAAVVRALRCWEPLLSRPLRGLDVAGFAERSGLVDAVRAVLTKIGAEAAGERFLSLPSGGTAARAPGIF